MARQFAWLDSNLAEHFTIWEPENLPVDEMYAVKKLRSTNLEDFKIAKW